MQNTLVGLTQAARVCNTQMSYEQRPRVNNVLTCSVWLQTPNWHPWTSDVSLTMPSAAKNSINPHIPHPDLLSFNAVCTPKPVFEYFCSTMTRLKCLFSRTLFSQLRPPGPFLGWTVIVRVQWSSILIYFWPSQREVGLCVSTHFENVWYLLTFIN